MGAAEWLAAGLLASALAAPVSQAWEQQRSDVRSGSGAGAGYVLRSDCGADAQGAGAEASAGPCLIELSSGVRLGVAMPLLPTAVRSAAGLAGGESQEVN
ncbi:hypothetical protein SynRS9909_01312 [Synechococcus sp. RS9909]|nr:hypothetical protein [Synechococcus sp. RS9917]EAQ69441.1 hypothetical protein RS9917_13395 [Synechococcus sp. RS9917]QNI79299.1 hypothetical protein SynRS9909_01312 [Synechococcus sp. RS9909]